MKTRILTIILAVCLVGAVAWGFTNYNQVGELKAAEMQLRDIIQDQGQQRARQEAQLKQAELEIDDLISERKMFRDKYELVAENYNQLEQQYQQLQSTLGKRETSYNELRANRDRWITAYDDLLAKYNQLTEQMKDADFLQSLLKLLLF